MAPIFSRKNALFLFLGVFALLFGMIQGASAVQCVASDPATPGTPVWNGGGTCDYPITYNDPGGSGLTTCQYQAINWNESLDPAGWGPAVANPDSCAGTTALMKSGGIVIGSTGDCTLNGQDTCWLYWKATDNSGNSDSGLLESFDINYSTAPTISDIADQTINEDANTGALAFTVGDAETAASSLTLTKDSSNTVLIPTANIVFGGSGANRTVTVSPAENQNGTATITVTVSDGSLTASDTFVLAVTAVNDAPTLDAITDPAAINEDAGSQTVNLSGISAGGGESQALTITATSATTSVIPNPTVTYASPNTTGSLSYTPVFNASGSSVITVTMRDAGLDETAGNADDGIATRTFTVNVTAVNDAPSFTKGANQIVLEDAGAQTVTGWATSISSGPTNESGQAVDFIVSNNNNALFSAQPAIAASGTLTYTPTPNANGSATVTVQIHDNGGTANSGVDTSASQTFTITVTAVNDSPIASNGTFTTNEDTAGTGTLVASDVDGNLLTFSIVANGIKGTATITNVSTGVYTYDPNDNQNGTDSFTFKANDGTIDSNTATVSVTITVVNDAPVAADESYSMYEGTTLTRNAAAGVLTNDSDVEGSALTAAVVSIPTNGSLILNSNGSLVYTPIANFNGTDSFTYKANDGTADSNTATVTITVSDGTAPTVDSFKANNKTYPNPPTVNVNGSFLVEWDVSETGGSNLQKVEVWRAWDANGDGVLQFPSEWGDSSPASGTQANPISIKTTNFDSANQDADSLSENPSDGTYWYGLHIVDNAGNCITETGGHCDGVSSDSLDARTVRGPIKVRMQHNSSPAIQGNVGISPAPPVKAGVALTFSVDWNDSDSGEQVKIHICKDVLSGTSCNAQGSWCASPSFTTNDPATCTYTTLATDGGTKAYNAYACDDEDACSGAKSGTFLVDTQAPTISSFTRSPVPPAWISTGSPNATITWAGVSDPGGANLKQIEVWRAWDANGNGVLDTTPTSEWGNPGNGQSNPLCTKTGGPPKCTQDQNFDTASTDSDSYIDTNLLASSVYWYGLHVVDKADNMGTESTPLKVQVDKDEPTAIIDAPTSSWLRRSAQQQSFLKTTDEDLDSGINTSSCTFEVCSYEPNGTEHCKGTEGRACNITGNTEEIFVGPGATHCDYQGWDACTIFVGAVDLAGNTAESFQEYNVDWEFPVVGKLYITATEGGQTYPIHVQNNSPVTYKVHAADNLGINYCNLYIDGILEQGFVVPSGCTTDCTVEFDGVALPDPGGDHTYSNNYAVCYDASTLASQGTAENIVVETLGVTLSAVPSSGSANTLFDLAADTAGSTMPGNTTYGFGCRTDTGDCTADGNFADCDFSITTSQTSYTKVDLCQYPVGTYTAKVSVQRGAGTAEDTVPILVSVNNPPNAASLQNNNTTADYCFVSSPPVILSWQFSDQEDGSLQSAYRVQIATNPGFGSPTDTCPPPQGEEGGTCVPPHNAQEYAPTGLAYATTYYWRIKVRDSAGDFSSSWANGPSFTTRAHPYPVPSFTWSPASPSAQESVQFCSRAEGVCPTNVTTFASGSTGQSFSWNFGDPDSGANNTSTLRNPSHSFTKTYGFGVTLQAGDDVGSCPYSQTVNVSVPFPEWQEISPF